MKLLMSALVVFALAAGVSVASAVQIVTAYDGLEVGDFINASGRAQQPQMWPSCDSVLPYVTMMADMATGCNHSHALPAFMFGGPSNVFPCDGECTFEVVYVEAIQWGGQTFYCVSLDPCDYNE